MGMFRMTFFLLLLFTAFRAGAQNVVTGNVFSASDKSSLAGVTVSAKGTALTTVTNASGDFSITLPASAPVLVFSYVGKKTVEMNVAGQPHISVAMQDDVAGMDEVVAIGYGSSRKKDLLGAVGTVKVGENFKGRPSSLGNILQGQIPGVNITQSGDPTAGIDITIRGKGNRNGDPVLFVVDGVPGAPFNPADVESISVLKDASSAAIYGALAGSGGVVLITTRQAKQGKVAVEVNAWNGYQQAWRLPTMLTAEQFNTVWKDAAAAAGKTVPKTYDPAQFPYGNVTRTDWVNEIFRKGKMQHYDLTMRGGTNDIKTLASVGYDRTEGTLITTYAERLTSRLNVEMRINRWLSVAQNLLYDYSNGKSGIGGGHTGTIFGAMAYPRFSTVHEYDSLNKLWLYGGTVPRWAQKQGFSVEADLRNPVAMLEKVRQNNPQNRIFSFSSLRLNLLPGLTFKSDFALDVINQRNESFQLRFLEPGRTINENYRVIANGLRRNWNWENVLAYNKTLSQVHHLSLMAAMTMNRTNYRYESTEMRGFNLEDPYSTIFPNGADWQSIRPNEEIWNESTVSALGRASYSYDDRYFVSASLRRDASSKLNPDKNYDFFPAVSGSWKISSEKFMQGIPAISFLKVRASWGEVGNVRSVRRFVYAPPFQVTGWPLFLGSNGQVQAFGIYQPTIPNPNLKWERSEQTNIGLDANFFNNTLTTTVDYFTKKTKDLIEQRPMPSVAGVASPPEFNVGSVLNKGWEFTVGFNKAIGAVLVNAGGNVSFFNNTVQNIGANAFIQHDDDVNSMKPLRSTVGQPWQSYYLIATQGIFRSQEEIDAYTWKNPATNVVSKIQPNAKPGDLKFIDNNNDGIINDGDRMYMGAYDMPKFAYGFNTALSWKGFAASAFFQGVSGVKIFNGVKAMTYTGLKGWNMSADVLNSYNYNPNSNIPRLAVAEDPNGNFSKVSDFFLEKGDYLRLKSLNLSYTLPASLLTRSFLAKTKIRIYVNGENLFTFTPYSGFDPEVGNNGVDAGRFPVSRAYSAGIHVSF